MNNNIEENYAFFSSTDGENKLGHDSRRARRHWRQLAEVLKRRSVVEKKSVSTLDCNFEIRLRKFSEQSPMRFESFELIRWEPTDFSPEDDEKSKIWWRATLKKPRSMAKIPPISLLVKFVAPSVNADDLAGFDNTGNVRVWASEEIMAFWSVWSLLAKLRESADSGLIVCELAGGMTCLSGLFLAAALSAFRQNGDYWASIVVERLILTDGNEKCIENARSVYQRNSNVFRNGCARIEHRLLKFGPNQSDDLKEKVDIVLAADCLFFAGTHEILLETLNCLLKPAGRAFLFAPERHGTLRQFVSMASRQESCRFGCRLVDLRECSLFDGVLGSSEVYDGSFGNGNEKGSGNGIDFPKLLILEKY